MRAATSARRLGPSFGTIFLILAAMLFAFVAAVAVTAALWALGKIELPFLSRGGQPSGPPPGKVKVFVSATTIPAYSKLTRDHIWDTKKNDFAVQYVTPEAVKERGFITDFNKLFGRVLDHEKPAGYAFTEKDLLPEGTRPGVVAGVPEGKRLFTLEVDKVQGIHLLRAGDHFDLVGTLHVNDKATPHGGYGPLQGRPIVVGSAPASGPKRVSSNVLVQDAIVITPVAVRIHAVDPSRPPPKTPPKDKPIEEVTIAIDPSEVAPLSEALTSKADLTCVARSGRPDDPKDARLPTADDPKVWVMESIKGKNRETLVFPIPPKPATESASVSVGHETARDTVKTVSSP